MKKLVYFIYFGLLINSATGVEKYDWTLGHSPDQIIPYQAAPGVELKLNTFFPEGHMPSDKRACVVFFFGGGWVGGSPNQFYGMAQYFASRGMVAVSAQYRTARSHEATPNQCVQDGREAIRYIREHAADLGVAPEKIVAGGGSAGGHIAAAVAMCPKMDLQPESSTDTIPNALILLNPVYDNGPEGYGHERVAAYWQDISPMHNIKSGLPPAVCIFGDTDKHVPVATIKAFEKKMLAAGNVYESHIYEGGQHGFFHIKKGGRAVFEDVLIKLDAFLVKQDFLSGRDTVQEWTAKSIESLESAPVKKRKR